MVRRHFSHAFCLVIATLALTSGRTALGVDPNELQSAYWRLEEGVADGFVPAPPPANPQNTFADTVQDSINNNDMQAFNSDTAPKYINYSLPPTPLKSGLPNTLAWEVDGSSVGGRDVYTIDEKIQNGIVGGKFMSDHDNNSGTPKVLVDSTTTGFTLEAAFSVFDISSMRAIIAKEGRPGYEMDSTDPVVNSLPTLALKVRGAQFEGDPDAGKLQIELFDGAGNLVDVTTDDAMSLNQWYYAAVVNDGETLSLYLDSNDGAGYQLEGSTAVDGALFQGLNHDNADWNRNWTIGRAVYGDNADSTFNEFGAPADWFNGLIDEVRLTNSALDPSEFLFAQDALAGDFDGDGRVDGDDFLVWQRGVGSLYDNDDLNDWKANFGQSTVAAAGAVPEPASWCLLCLAVSAGVMARRRLA